VTVTVYEPATETMIDCVVAPVDQRFPVADDDVRVIVVPAQKALGPLIVGVGGAGFNVTTKGADVAEPPSVVTVTVYEPAVETTIDCVVAPVDQRFPVTEDDVSVMLVPAQKELGPLIVGVAGGAALDVTANRAEVAEQPPAFVTVTVYEPPAETVIDCVVSPVDQRLPVAEDEVSVMVVPAVSAVGPLMVGVATGFAATTLAADAADPSAFVTVTVYVPGAVIVIDCVVAPVDQWLPAAIDEVRVIVLVEQNPAAPLMVGFGGVMLRPLRFQGPASDGAAPAPTRTVLFMNHTVIEPLTWLRHTRSMCPSPL
jgi:hypothetical protein